jgi:hypothetical protein
MMRFGTTPYSQKTVTAYSTVISPTSSSPRSKVRLSARGYYQASTLASMAPCLRRLPGSRCSSYPCNGNSRARGCTRNGTGHSSGSRWARIKITIQRASLRIAASSRQPPMSLKTTAIAPQLLMDAQPATPDTKSAKPFARELKSVLVGQKR